MLVREVSPIHRADKVHWNIRYSDIRKLGETTEEVFDAVFVCNGYV